jgi:hypothetical protein
MRRQNKQKNKERNRRTQQAGEDGLQYLRESIGLSDDQIASLVIQVRSECPSLNTKRKAVARLLNSVQLFREECKGFCRANERYRELKGPMGEMPPTIAYKKETRAMKQSGLDKFLERQEKARNGSSLEGRRWLPTPAEIAGEEGDSEIRKLLWGIASEEATFHEQQLAQLLRWGAILSRVANGRKNKRK